MSGRKVQIAVIGKLAQAGSWALDQLGCALASRGWGVEDRESLSSGPGILIGLGEAVQDRLLKARIDLPAAPGSLVIHRLSDDHLLVAGPDEPGLVYALMEIARAVELSREDADPFAGVVEEVGSPELQWRSMQLFLFNAELEAQWYFRESFWDEYLGQLARFRYNNLSLTFAHQTSYMAPPYPAHVELPEFPNVQFPDITSEQRKRNLEMLRRISEMTRQRGLHFTLGVWSQHDCGYGML